MYTIRDLPKTERPRERLQSSGVASLSIQELLQVLINILKNAKDELIKLDANKRRIIFIDTYTDKSNLIIKIRDNANGIPSDIIEKIFDPYFTTKENDEGTGIGLYMCKQIIDGMTGKIQVKKRF